MSLFSIFNHSLLKQINAFIDQNQREYDDLQTEKTIYQREKKAKEDIPEICESRDENIRYSLRDSIDDDARFSLEDSAPESIKPSTGVRYSLKRPHEYKFSKRELEDNTKEGEVPVALARLLADSNGTFADALIKYIDKSGMKDSDVYTRAGVSRQLFNNIKNVQGYKPSKMTALALILALRLPISDSTKLLNLAGFAFSRIDKTDMIIKYCIENGIYDFNKINKILLHYNQSNLLG